VVVLIIGLVVLAIGVVLLWARWAATGPGQGTKGSVVRSWLAMSLVAGLLLLSGLVFAVDDSSLRSTLVGALGTAVGSATAFYFSSKSSSDAQKALVNASVGTEIVPNLVGLTEEQASAALGKTSLKLVTAPSSPAPDSQAVKSQDPVAGSEALKGASVTVTYQAP
jgi:hypothetical protein